MLYLHQIKILEGVGISLTSLKRICLLALSVLLSCSWVGVTETHAASDSAGLSWYSASGHLASTNLNDIVMNDNQVYVAVGDEGTILSSSDARTWIPANLASKANLTTAATNGKTFVAAGERAIVSSTDGVHWTTGKLSRSYTFEELLSPDAKKYYDANYKIDWKSKIRFSDLNVDSVIWDGKRYAAIGNWTTQAGVRKKNVKELAPTASLGGSIALTSADGIAWNARRIDAGGKKLVFTGSQYVTMDMRSVYLSTDLAKWKKYNPDVFQKRNAYSPKDLIYANGTFVAIGWDAGISAQTGLVYTSKDGIHWTEKKLFKNRILNTVYWDGTQYWIGGAHGLLYRSKNLTDWDYWKDASNNPWEDLDFAGEQASVNRIIFDGKRYVLAGNRQTIIVSDRMYSAEIVRQRPPVDFEHIGFDGNNRYVAGGDTGTLMESRNGYDWQPADLGDFSGLYWHWTDVAAGNGVALALGRIQDGLHVEKEEYFYSPSPGIWERKKFPILFKIPDGVEFKNGKFYVYCEGGYITSTDGISWSKLTKMNPGMKKAVSNGKIQVGLAAYKYQSGLSEGTVFASSDGLKWKKAEITQNKKKDDFIADDLIWNGKQFIAVGVSYPNPPRYEGTAFSSPDGITWKYNVLGVRFDSLACNVKACAAASAAGDLYASAGDLNFKVSSKPTKQKISKVLWDGEKFIALGEGGTILVSKKPVNASKPAEEQIVPFDIKIDPNASFEPKPDPVAAAFRAEAEQRIALVKQVGTQYGYEPYVEEGSDVWMCRLNYTESIAYETFKSGEYRNKLSFAVFFNGIDEKQLNAAKDIIGQHTGASADEAKDALKTVVNGNANAAGTTQVGGVAIKYSLTMQQGKNSTYGNLEIWY